MLRFVVRLILVLALLVTATLAGFRVWAAVRETTTAQDGAGPGAQFITADGLSLHYREWGPSEGRALLLVPGTLAWAETFHDIAAPLGDAGVRVIALDLPPFGYSQRPDDGDYSRRAQARRLLAFADSMGLENFVLGVHSYGGGAAMEAAFSHPARIDGLVLLDVALGLGRPHAPPTLAPLLGLDPVRNAIVALTFANPLAIPIGLRDFIHDDLIVTPARSEIYKRPLAVEGTTGAIGDWLLTGLLADEGRSLAANEANYRVFRQPALVIWGAEDTVTPLDQGRALTSLFSRGELRILDNVNHIPHVEKPFEVVRLIADFLRHLDRASVPAASNTELRGTLTGG